MLQINGHCCFSGNTGYNIYSQGFFQSLKKLYPSISIRDFSEKMNLYNDGDINIILNETNHPHFYDKYNGIKIAYNMWETTKQPDLFFDKLQEFDQLWVPSEWQKKMSILQGYPEDKIHVVPGACDPDFTPMECEKKDIVTFLMVGSWCFRKSTKEMIQCFLETFDGVSNVRLIISVDSPFSKDGFNSTENRLEHYGLVDDRIIINHFTDRDSYIKMIRSCDIFVSCSRGEGWNLPLLESLCCGKPSIFSNCGGQLEYTKYYPLSINISKEIPAICKQDGINFTGNYYEPDFDHFKKTLRYSYDNLDQLKKVHLELSKKTRTTYNWENSAKISIKLLESFFPKNNIKPPNEFYTSPTNKELLTINTPNVNGSIYTQIFHYEIYNDHDSMKIKDQDVVLDIGAHIGIFSRYASTKGASRVFSFELDPMLFSCLKSNIRENDVAFNCVILNSNFSKFKLDNNVIVNGFDLNHFFDGQLFGHVDFMKIDVMGKEMILLNSIRDDVYAAIEKISIKTYKISNEDKIELITSMKNRQFTNHFNIITPELDIQFLYFWK